MVTIKSYTDIEQSRKLVEILPLESANMFHFIHEVDTVGFGYKKDAQEFYSKTEFEYIPCWSLAALLSVLPIANLCAPTLKMKLNHKYYMELCIDSHKYISTNDYNNPVDACYEMILKLNEINLL